MIETSYHRHSFSTPLIQQVVWRCFRFMLMIAHSGFRLFRLGQFALTRPARVLTFRIAITAAVIAFITALTACLIFIQLETFHAAARAAASAAMDSASANTLSRLEADMSGLSSVVHVLSSTPLLADSEDRSEDDGAIALFKAALQRLPQADSLYVGYENGSWLQVRRVDVLNEAEQ